MYIYDPVTANHIRDRNRLYNTITSVNVHKLYLRCNYIF